MLKSLICQTISLDIRNEEDLTYYEALVSYDSDLRSYIASIQKAVMHSQTYWTITQKRELDFVKTNKIGLKLINDYR
jgi:hypothetical protein